MAKLPIVIVGAGFSGTLLAVNLLRNGARVVLVERNEAHLAKGLAFGTRQPEHLLNVRAANMSAYPDDAGHFLRWMKFDTAEQANRFVPRPAYGHYLREQLMAALSTAPERIRILTGEARVARFDGGAVTVNIAGEDITTAALVLALGNLAPSLLPALAQLPGAIYFPDAWMRGAVEALDPVQDLLLLGAGLTAMDVVTTLDRSGWRGRITALSRRGLRPHAHLPSGPAVIPVARPEARGSWLVRRLRERARQVDWRVAVDELRPHTQDLWRSHDGPAQRRFLNHLRPYWDIHRHRLAPQVAERIAALEAEGRLTFIAGKLLGATMTAGGAEINWRPRGSDHQASGRFGRIIGCTGSEGDITRASDPLLRNLLAQHRIRPDAHRLGLDVDHSCRVKDARGDVQDRLFAVGPMTRGDAWEIIAVPDIRRQVWNLARFLTNTHWVGGEGL